MVGAGMALSLWHSILFEVKSDDLKKYINIVLGTKRNQRIPEIHFFLVKFPQKSERYSKFIQTFLNFYIFYTFKKFPPKCPKFYSKSTQIFLKGSFKSIQKFT